MHLFLECQKCRRSGILPAFLGGGALAAAIPLLNMVLRLPQRIEPLPSPTAILLEDTWPAMAMLNAFLTLCGACMLYHLEMEGQAISHLRALPLREGGLFGGKLLLLGLLCLLALLIEAAAVGAGAAAWFHRLDLPMLLKSFAFSFGMLLPSAAGFLLIAGACKSLWVPLGIGVIAIFIAAMLPDRTLLCALFPFSLPFRTWTGLAAGEAPPLAAMAAAELAGFAALEMLFIRLRRVFS